MIKGFIFDLDGVITDTAEQHYVAWKKLADSKNWKFNRELNENLRGVSRLDSIKIIIEHNNAEVSEEEMKALMKMKNDLYVESLDEITPNDFLPGAKELLTELKGNGYKIALGSASKNSHKVLTQLDALLFFDVIGDGNSVSKSKPAPDVFLYGAEKLGLQSKECIVYEDAESGVDAAKSGGFYSVGIGPNERVGHANICFESMQEASFKNVKAQLIDTVN
jgi:beta-phosphoglucomutase